MNRDIYKSGYKFASEQDKKRVRILKIVSILVPLAIILFMCAGFVSSLDLFSKKEEKVDRLFEEQEKEREEAISQAEKISQAYKDAKIPYTDPNGKFSIIFLTPYISNEIAVVINNENSYDESKVEADKIIQAAKERVDIGSITYIKNY